MPAQHKNTISTFHPPRRLPCTDRDCSSASVRTLQDDFRTSPPHYHVHALPRCPYCEASTAAAGSSVIEKETFAGARWGAARPRSTSPVLPALRAAGRRMPKEFPSSMPCSSSLLPVRFPGSAFPKVLLPVPICSNFPCPPRDSSAARDFPQHAKQQQIRLPMRAQTLKMHKRTTAPTNPAARPCKNLSSKKSLSQRSCSELLF